MHPSLRLIACAGLLLAAACGGNNASKTPDASGVIVDARVADAPLSTQPDAAPIGYGLDARPPLVNDAGQPLCQTNAGYVVCQCSNGIDDDHDGYIDSADPECTGPYDNDESSFATGIPGDNSDPYVQDCFFDGNSGGGNDGCRWDIRCDNPPDGQHCNNNQLAGCAACMPLVPNGCDCFGCCDIYVNNVPHTVRIVDTCTAAVIDNPTLCPPCTKVAACQNPCDPCEVCIGHTPDPSCGAPDGGVAPGQCPTGVSPCIPPDNACPFEYTCITGCCIRNLQ